MGASVNTLLAEKTLASAREVMKGLAQAPVTAAELEIAKNEALSQMNKELAKPDGVANAWLDSDTFGLPSLAEQTRALSAITAADLQRVAARLIHDGAFASVVVGNADVLKAQLERTGKVEVFGEIVPKVDPKPEPKTDSSAKPQIKIPAKPE